MLLLLSIFTCLMSVTLNHSALPIGVSPADIIAIAAIGLGVVRCASYGPIVQRYKADLILLALYLGQILISSLYHQSSLYKFLGSVELVAIYFLILTEASLNKGTGKRLLIAWILSASFFSGIALVGSVLSLTGISSYFSYPSSAIPFVSRAKGLSVSPNFLASYLLFPFLIFWERLPQLSKWQKWSVLPIAIALPLTASRTILAVLLVTTQTKLKSKRLIILLFFLTILFSSIFFQWGKLQDRFSFSAEKSQRRELLSSAFHTAIENPLFGIGPDALAAKTEKWPNADAEVTYWRAHNTALDVAASFGMPALLFLLGFVFILFKRSKQSPYFHWILLGFLFDSLSLDMQNFRHLWVFFAIMTAVIANDAKEETKSYTDS